MIDLRQLIKLPVLQYTGIKTEITASHKTNSEIIRLLWKRFNANLHKVENRKVESDWKKFGLTFKLNDKYYYSTAIEFVDKIIIPSNFEKFTIGDLEYCLFEHKGNLQSLRDTVNKSFEAIKKSDFVKFNKDNASSIMMIEKYDQRFYWNSPNSIIDILVPVVRKQSGQSYQ